MAHFAKIGPNNIVEMVLVGRDEDENRELELSARTGDTYRRTSYNTRGGVYYGSDGQPSADQSKAFRKNYAGIGYTWDEQRNAFYPPKPFNSWTLNETTCLWDPPVPMPSDAGQGDPPKMYAWDEETVSWKAAPAIPMTP